MSAVDSRTPESESAGQAPTRVRLRSRYDDHQVLGPLVGVYVMALPKVLAQVTDAFDAKEFSELKRLCHRLCGEAATFGFDELALAARQTEVATESDNLDKLRSAQLLLVACVQRIAL